MENLCERWNPPWKPQRAFGGSNLDRLFVTTGVHKTLVEENAGKVWVVDGLGVSGVEAFCMLDSIRSIPFQAPVDCIA